MWMEEFKGLGRLEMLEWICHLKTYTSLPGGFRSHSVDQDMEI